MDRPLCAEQSRQERVPLATPISQVLEFGSQNHPTGGRPNFGTPRFRCTASDETPQHPAIDHTSHQGGEGSLSSILGLAQRISTAFDAISARVLMSQQSPCSLLVLLLIGLLTVETGTQLLLHLLRLGGGPWSYVKSSFVLSSLVHASDSREDNLLRSQASPSASPLCPCPCTTDNEVRTHRHSLHGQLFLHL